jgi:hypothetical protein
MLPKPTESVVSGAVAPVVVAAKAEALLCETVPAVTVSPFSQVHPPINPSPIDSILIICIIAYTRMSSGF